MISAPSTMPFLDTNDHSDSHSDGSLTYSHSVPMVDEVEIAPLIGDLPAPLVDQQQQQQSMGSLPYFEEQPQQQAPFSPEFSLLDRSAVTDPFEVPAVADVEMKRPAKGRKRKSMSTDDDTKTVSSAEPVKPQKKRRRRRKRKVIPPEVIKERRRRHNEVEIRRRTRIAANFEKLRTMSGCDGTSKGDILSAAVDTILHLQNQLEGTNPHAAKLQFTTSHSNRVSNRAAASCVLSTDGSFKDCNEAFAKYLDKSVKDVCNNPEACELVTTFTTLVRSMVDAKTASAECTTNLLREGLQITARCMVLQSGAGDITGLLIPLDKTHWVRGE